MPLSKCLHRYIPASHHLGHLTYTLSENDEANVLNQTVADVEKLGEPGSRIEPERSRFTAICRGTVRSQRIQPAALRSDAALLSSDVRAGLGWNGGGVIVSGKDSRALGQLAARRQTDLDRNISRIESWTTRGRQSYSTTLASNRKTRHPLSWRT
jgi:hypothetical protein